MTALTTIPFGGLRLRLHHLGRAVVVMLTSVPASGLFAVWVTAVAISPLTVVAVLVLPVTAAVRWYAGLHRRDAQRVLGLPVPAPYRPVDGGLVRQVWLVVRDPASWRDAAWLLVHAVVGFTLAIVQVTLALATLFYLAFPFLYWVTPQQAFGKAFGVIEIHSVAEAAAFAPLALVAFLLWYGLSVPLTRADARITRAMLSP